jgi:hypothetical protein
MKKLKKNSSNAKQNDLKECLCEANGEKQSNCLSEGRCPIWEIVTVLPIAFTDDKMIFIRQKQSLGKKNRKLGKNTLKKMAISVNRDNL